MKKVFLAGLMAAALPVSVAWADVTEDRDVDSFHEIKLDGLMEATIVVGEEQSVSITVNKERYIDDIETRVRNGRLYVSMDIDDGFFSMFRDIEIEVVITVPELDYFEMDGLGDVDIRGVDSDDFRLTLDGMGSIDVSGTCGRADIVLDGMGDLKAKNFECKEVRLVLDGMGDATIYASDYANVTLDGFGNVDVYGEPEKTRFVEDGFGDIHVK